MAIRYMNNGAHKSASYFAVKPVWNEHGEIVDFEYTEANNAAEVLEYDGFSNITGSRMPELFPETHTSFLDICKKVFQSGVTEHYEYYNAVTLKWFEIVVVKMLGGLIIIFTNITDSKKAADLLQQNYDALKVSSNQLFDINQQLERSNMDLMQFASVASHDLKEPLRKIQSFGNVLLAKIQDKLDDTEKVYFGKIISASVRMQHLIEDILMLAKLSDDSVPKSKTDLRTIVTRVMDDLEITIREKNAEIILGNLPVIEAVPGQMQQLFQNLLVNALKFNDKPQVKIHIGEQKLSPEKWKAYNIPKELFMCIVVEDNGIGFEPEYRQSIFDIFQRLHGRTYDGTGIGLTIARKIAGNHKGYIYAEAEPGKGARFLIFLPSILMIA